MDLCEKTNKLAHSIAFDTVFITLIVMSTIAIVAEIWIMFKTKNRILIHQNTRILIIAHQLCLIFHCVARILVHTYVLMMHWKTHVDTCRYMISGWECLMMRVPTALTLLLNGASIPVIVIERAIATYSASRYEKFGNSVAVILIMTKFAIAIGNTVYVVNTSEFLNSKEVLFYCLGENDENIFKTVVRFLRSKIHGNLSHRYQIMENISSIQTLTPIVVFHSLFFSFYLGSLLIYFVFDFNFSTEQSVIYLEIVQQIPLYALALPFAIFWTEKYVRKIKQANRQKAMELSGTEAANHYFAIFETPVGKNVRKFQR